MSAKLLFLTTSLALIPAMAVAQGTSATSGTSKSGAQSSGATQSAQPLPQQLEQKLKNQGFTDVQVVPGSYIVSAKDKDGDPVTAIIGPNSMTVFTMSTGSGASTTGSGAASGSGSSSMGSGSESGGSNSKN